jgi:hypothetical protein
MTAGSTDHCNTFCELLNRSLIEQGLSRSFIELPCDCAGLDQHHVARMALDKCYDIAVPRSADQVALPVTWDRTIFNRCWPFSDGYRILDLAEPAKGLPER